MEIDIKALAEQMITAVRGFVAKAEIALGKRIDDLELKLKTIPAGPKGDKGDQGEKGESIRGEKGDPGKDADPFAVQRSIDEAVSKLPKPADGKDGVPGLKGESIKGDKGDKGEPGAPGKEVELTQVQRMVDAAVAGLPKPKDGKDGKDGAPGLKGEAIKGDKGDPGEAIKGDKGDRGVDADPVHVQRVVEQAVASLPKPKDGKDGAPGLKGEAIKGDKGEPGAPGAPVDPELIRQMVKQVVAELPKPKDGKDGEDGRDAAELEILPSIDEAKSYRRGTWASHNGGEIKALRTTDPVKDGNLIEAGWTVMREGVAALVITQGADPREIQVASVLTSGAKIIASFRIPMIIYQGVWREGEYQQGDVATWGGSAWHSQVDKNIDKPGSSAAWKMMVKEGAKGKDAGGPPAAASGKTVHIK